MVVTPLLKDAPDALPDALAPVRAALARPVRIVAPAAELDTRLPDLLRRYAASRATLAESWGELESLEEAARLARAAALVPPLAGSRHRRGGRRVQPGRRLGRGRKSTAGIRLRHRLRPARRTRGPGRVAPADDGSGRTPVPAAAAAPGWVAGLAPAAGGAGDRPRRAAADRTGREPVRARGGIRLIGVLRDRPAVRSWVPSNGRQDSPADA